MDIKNNEQIVICLFTGHFTEHGIFYQSNKNCWTFYSSPVLSIFLLFKGKNPLGQHCLIKKREGHKIKRLVLEYS